MTDKQINIAFEEYSNLEEMTPEDRELANEAVLAMQNAYAPYSHFHVGAAVRMSNSQIVRGSNQENAAFPSGLCAERTAMFSASARYPDKDMTSIALAGGVHGRLSKEPVSPCGACRQVMAQYQAKSGKPMSVIMVGADRIFKFHNTESLLPLSFDKF